MKIVFYKKKCLHQKIQRTRESRAPNLILATGSMSPAVKMTMWASSWCLSRKVPYLSLRLRRNKLLVRRSRKVWKIRAPTTANLPSCLQLALRWSEAPCTTSKSTSWPPSGETSISNGENIKNHRSPWPRRYGKSSKTPRNTLKSLYL